MRERVGRSSVGAEGAGRTDPISSASASGTNSRPLTADAAKCVRSIRSVVTSGAGWVFLRPCDRPSPITNERYPPPQARSMRHHV